ncbi:hypothetical protein RMATCC62417_12266 [Rhizopus microsporus]|nr:hypothetical protein RMATCC62417_12266 [Rhizopus microsporus]
MEAISKKSTVFSIENMMDPLNNTFDFLDVKVKPVDGHVEEPVPTTKEAPDVAGPQEVDELFPTSLPPQKELVPKKLTTANEALKRREWAHEINVNEPFENFHDLVPEMAMQLVSFFRMETKKVRNKPTLAARILKIIFLGASLGLERTLHVEDLALITHDL